MGHLPDGCLGSTRTGNAGERPFSHHLYSGTVSGERPFPEWTLHRKSIHRYHHFYYQTREDVAFVHVALFFFLRIQLRAPWYRVLTVCICSTSLISVSAFISCFIINSFLPLLCGTHIEYRCAIYKCAASMHCPPFWG